MARVDISDLSAYCKIRFDGYYTSPFNSDAAALYLNGSKVVDLVIPEGVTSIPYNSFEGCSSIVTLTLANTVTSIGENAFCNCNKLRIVAMGNSLSSIGDGCFFNLSRLSVPELPNTIKEIGAYAFSCGKGSMIKVNATTPPTLLGALPMTVALVPDASVSAYKAAEYWKDMTILSQEKTDVEITMTDGVTLAEAIVRQARIAPASVTKLKVHGSLTNDDLETIKTMTNCYSIDLSDTGIETIPDKMFSGRTTLENIVLPKNLKAIGNYAFTNCSLKSVVLPNTLESIGIEAFEGNGFKDINLPESLKTIGEKAFRSCYNIRQITLPKDVTLGFSVFELCTSLKSVDISQLSNTAIPPFTFRDCSSLESIKLPLLTESIGTNAFCRCTQLKYIESLASVKTIKGYAFNRCTSLKTLNLSASLTTLPEGAFYLCTSVNVINCPAPVPPTMDTDVFADVNKEKCVLTIPNDKYFEYFVAPYWGQFLENTSGVLVNILDTNGSVKYGVSGGNATTAPIRAMSVQTTNNDDDITAEAFNNANICVKGNMSLTFKITPDEGYQIETVKYAGKDVTSQVVDGIFTTPAITGDTQIDVSFKEKLGVEDVATSDLKVWSNGMSIYVQTTDRATVNVTSLSGVTRTYVAEAGVTEIAMSAPGIYIVNGKKVVVR